MADHDHSYKQLFSHAQLVKDLLEGFIEEEWVANLDIDTLERVNGSYVSDDLREREDDIIWRVKLGGSWVYVYLLIEFQSTVDKYMAVRLMTYIGLLYQDLQKTGNLLPDGKLPPVLPLVLYNGRKQWNATTSIKDLIQNVAGGLSKYRPDFQYLLIEERRFQEADLPAQNLVSAIFQLENSRYPEDVHKVVKNLILWLKQPEQTTLRRAFTVWINRVLLPIRLPGQTIPTMNELMEVETMLAERVVEWTKEWKAEGLQQGIQQGMQQGTRQVLRRQLFQKFGTLPDDIATRLKQADEEQLLRWADLILPADNLTDIFGN